MAATIAAVSAEAVVVERHGTLTPKSWPYIKCSSNKSRSYRKQHIDPEQTGRFASASSNQSNTIAPASRNQLLARLPLFRMVHGAGEGKNLKDLQRTNSLDDPTDLVKKLLVESRQADSTISRHQTEVPQSPFGCPSLRTSHPNQIWLSFQYITESQHAESTYMGR